MAEIYTKSVIKIGNETFRNLPAQVDRDQEVSYDAYLKSQQAISAAADAQTKAVEAKIAADSVQSIATDAQTKATEAKTVADTAQSTANTAQAKATEAKTAADTAQTTATTAQNTANTAKSEAESATALANAAQEDATNAVVTAANAEGLASTSVQYDSVQYLTDEQKQLARSNIGVTEQGIVIDDELSTTSENPVQNRAITAQINLINTNVTNAQTVATNASGAAQQALQNASTAQSRANVSVRYDAQQVLTAAQEKQARGNISAKYNGGGQTLASNITSLNSTATATFDADIYKNIYVEVIPKTDSGYIGTTIPIAALETTDKRYQLTDEINYVSFKLKLSAKNGTVTLTYSMATRSQNTAKIVLIMAIP